MNHKERKNQEHSIQTFACLENMIKKFETPLHNLMENKKEAGSSEK